MQEGDLVKRKEENAFACIAKRQYGEPSDWTIQEIALADVRKLISELEFRAVNAEKACRQILENTRAFHYHYLAVQTLRELGRQQKLSLRGAKALLRSTAYTFAYYSGIEDGYTFDENVRAILCTKSNVAAIVQYVQKYLLEKNELQDGRWQAFGAIGQIVERWGTSVVPTKLKHALRLEAGKEEDPGRRGQFIEILEKKSLA